jgi:hypothetical protein
MIRNCVIRNCTLLYQYFSTVGGPVIATVSKQSEVKASIIDFFLYRSKANTFDSTNIYFEANRICLY